ncbi:endoplasmic reticulum-based factor for assembly of V-ATPase-domain-containing protein [Hypoxylon sp. FL1284]|nr:endoplasmic reticulum-based factor for assembly of V-ATPase-domain-containing protein [Hypoxylon sp. FL1284]
MVLLTMTPSMVEALQRLAETETDNDRQNDHCESNTPCNDEPPLSNPSVGKPISHSQIIDVWNSLKKDKNAGVRLEELLRGATVYVPPPPPKPEPTKEYKALMARLRHEEEERSYERMLKKAPPRESFAQRFPDAPTAHSFAEVNQPSKESDIGGDIEQGDIQKQVTLVINFLVSVFGCGAALWMAAQWWSVPARLFLSLGGSIAVAIAEVAVYSAYTWRMGEGEKNEKKKKEVRQVVQTWIVGEDEQEKKAVDQPREVPESDDPENDAANLRRRIKSTT